MAEGGYLRDRPEQGEVMEAKREVEPLVEVLRRAVARIHSELGMLEDRVGPVLRVEGPQTSAEPMREVAPHSSDVAQQVYELHALADRIAYLASRVEL